MAKYDSIHGTIVRSYTTDPDTLITGHVWYDKTAKTLQYQAEAAGAWATGNAMNSNRRGIASAVSGTQTAALGFGGGDPSDIANTESYDGTSWTEVSDLNTAGGSLGGAGIQTSALAFGRSPISNAALNESWDGSSWTEVGDLNTARYVVAGAGGSNTAALCFCGLTTPPTTYQVLTEEWNGSAWTEVGDLNTARSAGGLGQNTEAALAFGGYSGTANIDNVESWNGSAWTEVNDLNSAREQISGSGEYTDAIAFGGNPVSALNEKWNGTSWTEVGDLNTGRKKPGSSGTTTAAVAFSGQSNDEVPAGTALTEEWNSPTKTTVTFTVS